MPNEETKICPVCNNKTLIPILYGLTKSSALERAFKGEVILGGCKVGKENWYCPNCKNKIDEEGGHKPFSPDKPTIDFIEQVKQQEREHKVKLDKLKKEFEEGQKEIEKFKHNRNKR